MRAASHDRSLGRGARACGPLVSALLASLVGCGPQGRSGQPGALSLTEPGAPAPEARATPDPTAPTGSQSLAPSASGRSMTVVQVDEGVVLRVDLDTGERSGLVVGGAPSRVARFAGQTVVSLRAERSLALLPDEGPLVELGRVRVGAEPVGLVASRDGAHLYVALYGADEVLELDVDLQIVRRFSVPGRPAWLALHPGGRWLAVGAQLGGEVRLIDLGAPSPTAVPLPVPTLAAPDAAPDADRARLLSRRVTGDLAWSEDGAQLAAPMLFVDNTAVPKHTAEEALLLDPAYRYELIGLGMSPNNPMVALWPTEADGEVNAEGLRLLNPVGEASTGPGGATLVARSFLSGVAFSPDGALVLAPMESGDAVVALQADPDAPVERVQGLDRPGGLWMSSGGAGARAVAFLDEDDVWVHNFVDGELRPLPAEALSAAAEPTEAPVRARAAAGAPLALMSAPFDGLLDPEVTLGRRLFYSGITPSFTTPLSGVSCATCHFESRNDGLGWMEIDGLLRQTPSLAGPVSESAPFTWNNDVPTVAAEVEITSQARLGGRGGTVEEYEAVAAYLEQTPEIDHASRGARGEAERRGEALFMDGTVGCAACHAGPRLTDQQAHDLYGLSGVDTPSLIGLEATPPYLHDGSAPTIRAVLEGATAAGMGDVSGLSDADLDDLEAYLRSR